MPDNGAHVDHVMMVGVVEIGSGVHWPMGGRHMARVAGACIAVSRMMLWVHCAASAVVVDMSVVDRCSAATAGGIDILTAAAHLIAVAVGLCGNTVSACGWSTA